MATKVLNLYAGIGGNRKLWKDVDVTAVEWDEEKAEVYRDHFPDDVVVVTDAHEYLKEKHEGFDFIWASPPCPTHSRIRKLHTTEREQNDPVYPDMNLYQEILFLEGYFDGDWVVENVDPWYDPLIDAQKRGRHLFWSNYHVPDIEVESMRIQSDGDDLEHMEDIYGYDLDRYEPTRKKRRKWLRNCVHPKLGKHVFDAATKNRQATLF